MLASGSLGNMLVLEGQKVYVSKSALSVMLSIFITLDTDCRDLDPVSVTCCMDFESTLCMYKCGCNCKYCKTYRHKPFKT